MKIPAYQSVNRKAKVFRKLICLLKDISDSPDGMDQVFIAISIDFVSQSADPGFHHIGLRIKIIIPYMFHNHCL